MNFIQPNFLFLLILLPPLVFFLFMSLNKRQQALMLLGYPTSSGKNLFHHSIFLLGTIFVLLVLALARPQIPNVIEKKAEKKGVDLMLALDTSLSMFARDVAPDRISAAKSFVEELILNLTSDRLGLVFFSGDAFVQSPLTMDYRSLLMYLEMVEPGIIPVGGTALKLAIEKSAARLQVQAEKNSETESSYGRAIILISDGDDTKDDPATTASKFKQEGIFTYVIGVGSAEGEKVPDYDEQGRLIDFKKDTNGQYYLSKLNESLMKSVAQNGGGAYYNLQNSQETAQVLLRDLRQLKQKAFETSKRLGGYELYPFIALLAFLLGLYEAFLYYHLKPGILIEKIRQMNTKEGRR